MKAHSIGLMIKAELTYGTQYISVRVMRRKEDTGKAGRDLSPLNCTSSDYDLDMMALDDLELIGVVSDYDGRFNLDGAEYRSVHRISERRAIVMAKMLGKINRAKEKAQAHEPGDVFMIFAKAIGAKWVCRTKDEGAHYSSYGDVEWRWDSLEQGRETYRATIRKLEAEQAERGTTKGRQFA